VLLVCSSWYVAWPSELQLLDTAALQSSFMYGTI
jgi:hypothetical protein